MEDSTIEEKAHCHKCGTELVALIVLEQLCGKCYAKELAMKIRAAFNKLFRKKNG